MLVRLKCEHLETRENPSGPAIMDPIGIPASSPPPANVPSDNAPATATPSTTTPVEIAVQKIIDNTIAALNGQGW